MTSTAGRRTTGADPVVVVGGGLAGLAAAARLAKSGHPVELFEASDRLGGAWAPYELDTVLVDRAPSVLGFPAPWRDLFRKSGRPLEAELERIGMSLSPARPPHYVFADGSELDLPIERGEQYAVLSATYGRAAALRWRDLVDELDRVWQAVRPLGLESELRGRPQLRAVKKVLHPRQDVSQLAAQLDEPHLAALVRSLAYRLGSEPRRTPAWCAVELSVQRTFGRWAITSDAGPESGRSSVLVDALTTRLGLRRVTVHLNRRVRGLTTTGGAISGVATDDGPVRAAAVVCTTDPWQTYTDLVPPEQRRPARTVRRWRAALVPTVSHHLAAAMPTALTETAVTPGTVTESVLLSEDGVPTITYTRPTPTGILSTVHDYGAATPDRSAGLAWDGFRSWLDRPNVTSEIPGLFLAGPFSPGGSTPSAVVLSGALASYGCHDYLS